MIKKWFIDNMGNDRSWLIELVNMPLLTSIGGFLRACIRRLINLFIFIYTLFAVALAALGSGSDEVVGVDRCMIGIEIMLCQIGKM